MASETQEIVAVEEGSNELVTSDKKVEYSVKSEVISTVKTHETVTYVTEVRTDSETIENHVQETTEETVEEVKTIENGVDEEETKDEKESESEEKPKENGESEHAAADPEEKSAAEEPKVEANAEETVEAAPAEVVENAEAAPQIEEEPPKVILHQLPPVKDIVSRSPQCLALETFVKMAGIPYVNEYEEKAHDVTKENKGKIPYVVYKKKKVEGLKSCINFLKKEFDVETDKHLTPRDEAVTHAFRTMIEESTNWSLVYYRWVDNYGESKKMFSKLPPVLNVVSPKMFQNKCKKSIESHVIGRHNREELYNIAEQDLTALSAFLADKEYFMGELPSSFDAVVFGLLANFDYGAVGSPQQTLIRDKLPNLHEFSERMKLNYWLDWSDICGADKFVDKPKTSLVKRLSFRKRKPAKDEGEKSEPTSPSDGDKEGEEAKENGEAKESEEAKENGEAEGEAAKEGEEAKQNGEAEGAEKDESEDKTKDNEDKKEEEKNEDEAEKKDGEGETKSE